MVTLHQQVVRQLHLLPTGVTGADNHPLQGQTSDACWQPLQASCDGTFGQQQLGGLQDTTSTTSTTPPAPHPPHHTTSTSTTPPAPHHQHHTRRTTPDSLDQQMQPQQTSDDGPS
jgi:hypothetical protein